MKYKNNWQEEVKNWTAEDALKFFTENKDNPLHILRVVENSIRQPIPMLYYLRTGIVSCMRILSKFMDDDEYEKLCIMLMNEIYKGIWHNRNKNIGDDLFQEINQKSKI